MFCDHHKKYFYIKSVIPFRSNCHRTKFLWALFYSLDRESLWGKKPYYYFVVHLLTVTCFLSNTCKDASMHCSVTRVLGESRCHRRIESPDRRFSLMSPASFTVLNSNLLPSSIRGREWIKRQSNIWSRPTVEQTWMRLEIHPEWNASILS